MSYCYLKVFRFRQHVETKKIDIWPAHVGTSPTASFRLLDSQYLSEHLRLDLREEGIVFFCLAEPQFYPLLNGKKVKRGFVKSGDVLTLGTYDIAIYDNEPSQAVVPPMFGTQEPEAQIPVTEDIDIDIISEDSAPNEEKVFPTSVQSNLPKEFEGLESIKVNQESSPSVSSSASVYNETKVDSGIKTDSKLAKKLRSKKTKSPVNFKTSMKAPTRLVKSSTVEVLFCLEDEVVEAYHFSERKEVVIGGHEKCDVQVPIFAKKEMQHRFLSVGPQVKIHLTDQVNGVLKGLEKEYSFQDLKNNQRLVFLGGNYGLILAPGEEFRLQLPSVGSSANHSLLIRYVKDAPLPLAASVLDMTPSEVIGLVMSVLVTSLFAFYVSVNSVQVDEPEMVELAQPQRFAQLVYEEKPPEPPKSEPVKEPEPPKKEPSPPKEVKPEPPKPKPKPVAKKTAVKSKKKAKKKIRKKPVKKKGLAKTKAGPAQRIKPKNLPKAPKKVTSFRKGGANKLGENPGASATTKKKDVSKVGILGILGRGGIRSNMDEASTGVGILQGMANKTTGGVGEAEDIVGDSLGKQLKDDGAGSTGLSTVGIDNIGVKGLGEGAPAVGQAGIGERARPKIEIGGDEEDFVGKIDRDAIYRVIKRHEGQIRNCYERELNKNPSLTGKVVVKWTLGLGGNALGAQVVSSTLASPKVGECVVRRLRTWLFPEPPPGEEHIVTYPFNFVKEGVQRRGSS